MRLMIMDFFIEKRNRVSCFFFVLTVKLYSISLNDTAVYNKCIYNVKDLNGSFMISS